MGPKSEDVKLMNPQWVQKFLEKLSGLSDRVASVRDLCSTCMALVRWIADVCENPRVSGSSETIFELKLATKWSDKQGRHRDTFLNVKGEVPASVAIHITRVLATQYTNYVRMVWEDSQELQKVLGATGDFVRNAEARVSSDGQVIIEEKEDKDLN